MDESMIEVVGIVAGICTAASMLPQLIKMIKEKKAEDISAFFLIILFIGQGLWIYYGILRKDLPIVLTNAFSTLVNVSVIVLRVKYSKNKQPSHASALGSNTTSDTTKNYIFKS